jgi:hypothetical protein
MLFIIPDLFVIPPFYSLQSMAQTNIDLEQRLDHAESELEHKAANEAEKRAVEGALSLDKDKRIILANIPLSRIKVRERGTFPYVSPFFESIFPLANIPLKLEKMIGKGAFGEVIKGVYNGTQVGRPHTHTRADFFFAPPHI